MIYGNGNKIYTIGGKPAWTAYIKPAPYTLRFQFDDHSYVPKSSGTGQTASKGSWTAVDASEGIWDWTCENNSWYAAFENRLNENIRCSIIEAGDTSGVTATSSMFKFCTGLHGVCTFNTGNCTVMTAMFSGSGITQLPALDTSKSTRLDEYAANCNITEIPVIDASSSTRVDSMFLNCTNLRSIANLRNTGNVTNWYDFCYGCSSLQAIPALDVTAATDMRWAFKNCYAVTTGAYSLYQVASTKSVTVTNKMGCFDYCGRDGNPSELAQIPYAWNSNN